MSETAETEEKWLKRWGEAGVFESDPEKRDSFYLTVAYPYPSGGMHIGHARTYTVPDVIARYKRMQGFNVLYPMAWHVTGTPIIGALQRMREGEEKQMKVLREVYSMTDEDIDSIKEPMDFARYFIDSHYRPSMRGLGYAIDWRRQFTTNDPQYNAFITWQYETLHSRGLIKKGLHPVKYCIEDENPVTTHDLLEGTEADIQEFTLLKFKYGSSYIIAATLRPETMYGQTNMWVDPDVTYVKCDMDGQEWIVSRECAEKLRLQERKIKVKDEVKGSDLVGKTCRAPVIDRDILILPSSFPDPDIGTGLVTSVPSDAPYDWVALKDLQGDKAMCEKYGLNHEKVKAIKTIPIIDIEGYGPEAAKDVVERMGIKSQKDIGKLEEATKEVYKAGFHTGVMNSNCGKHKGMAVVRAKDKIKEELLKEEGADVMLEFSEPVRCRCGGKVVVAKAESWFIAYGNSDWKETVRGCIHNMDAIPARTKQDYLNTVDWLREWPCIRNYGLGTKLPFDERFTIEPLSDSTIYMAYYTISHLIRDIDAKKLNKDFFDYVFRGEGKPDEVAKATGIPSGKLAEIRESFDYWYPQDWRCSALELIQNHLTFMLYHHCAIFNADKWPKGIATFGMGVLEGEKMSSSKGNVVLVKTAIERHGADVVRLFLMGNAEPWQDFDWRENLVEATHRRLRQFEKVIADTASSGADEGERPIDRWLLSRLNRRIRDANACLQGFQTRKALQSIFYELLNDVAWYQRRTQPNRKVMGELANAWIRLMAPFTPFACEELWEKLGNKGFVAQAQYPQADESMIDDSAEATEDYLRGLMEDIQNILRVTKKAPKKISLYVSPVWKHKVLASVKEGKTIKDVMADPEVKKHGKAAARLMQTRKDEIPHLMLSPEDEANTLTDAKDFLSAEFAAEILVEPEADPEGKAKHAQPMKPGVYIE